MVAGATSCRLDMGVSKAVVAVGMQIVVGKEKCMETRMEQGMENGRGISDDSWLEAVLSTKPEVEVEVVADRRMEDLALDHHLGQYQCRQETEMSEKWKSEKEHSSASTQSQVFG